MQDTPLKSFRPTVKVVPFNYHSTADTLHFDVMSSDGWPKRKWSRGSHKLLLQKDGTITGMSLDAWSDWLHHIWCVSFTSSLQQANAHLFSWKSPTPKTGTADSSKTSVPSYQTIRRHISEENNLHNSLSSVTMKMTMTMCLESCFLSIRIFPLKFCIHFLFPNYMPNTP
jgi:hypothetical protein